MVHQVIMYFWLIMVKTDWHEQAKIAKGRQRLDKIYEELELEAETSPTKEDDAI